MARGDQLGRQWRIIQTLLTSKIGKSAADLAEEMEANPRTVYRDLEALQVAGFPIFALDRIKMLHQTKEPFQIAENFNLDEFLGASFGIYQGDPTRVKIRFSPEVAGYIKEKIWHDSQKLETQEDGSLLFEAVVAGTQVARELGKEAQEKASTYCG
jgi:predicted DNA-binding transcriptional regulator YafY